MNAYELKNVSARAGALGAMEQVSVGVTGLVEFQAGGDVLVIGGADAPAVAASLPPPLTPRVLSLDGSQTTDIPVIRAEGRSISIRGHLGSFVISLEGSGQVIEADTVLDLSPVPLVSAALKPPGYVFSPGAGPAEVQAALAQLSELTGTFDKPQFFDYAPDRCAHSRNGITACTRCIDACPAQAITSHGDGVEIDPYLCQGGGICASVCPSGAIRYTYPHPGDLGKRIRTLLKEYLAHGGLDPVVLLHTDGRLSQGLLESSSNLLPVEVEELASVGPEIWLSSLAFGARRVLLTDYRSEPDQVRAGINSQLELVWEILSGMGYPAGAVSVAGEEISVESRDQGMPPIKPAVHAMMEDKRGSFYLALDHLHKEAGKSRAMVELPAGAPFGAAFVEAKACTLCMACVSACPGNALQDGRGEPKLGFVEANCIQCGLCTRVCPENAIWITPRLVFDRDARNRQKLLHEEEPFCCVTCGKPFATRSVIDRVQSRLAGHWMYADDRSRRRLMMCEDCRVVDVVQDQETLQRGQIPQ